MTENIENIENKIIETKGLRDLILQELRIRRENTQLKKQNQLLSDELTYFKERCADLEEQINSLEDDAFLNAELLADQYENEIVSAMGSYLGDD